MKIEWKDYPYAPQEPERTIRQAEKQIAKGGYRCSNAIRLELKQHFSGSGPKAFGGAKQWPHLQLDVSFTVEEGFAGRDKLGAALEKFLTDYFANLE